ncbi:sulfite exporter TauE/SafE family protein [Desulfoferula mesophila]|uniref:Probable membrane transporter protein n=1 Tax=Desulfoferula mesophila TaxID=3058419 RepID=A0AAU9EH77_9BACT|nr:UPF0721 transmembrane protein [Desulfoferula mesophilus]
MDIYFPIAGLPLNLFMVLGIGGVVGFLSGLFGVGGGFLLTPLMMMVGIPPAVAAATGSNQMVGTAASAAFAHWRMGNVDFKMGGVILAGGLVGGTAGVQLVGELRALGNFEFVMKIIYVIMLGGVGGAMLLESVHSLRKGRGEAAAELAEISEGLWSKLCYKLPWHVNFEKSGLSTSVLFPFFIGGLVGLLSALLGVGGGFIMVPAMIYIIRMPTLVAIGTDLFQMVLSSANVAIQQAYYNQTVDVLLALLLLAASAVGAQLGAMVSLRLKGEHLRVLLAACVLAVTVKLFLDLALTPSQPIFLTPVELGH